MDKWVCITIIVRLYLHKLQVTPLKWNSSSPPPTVFYDRKFEESSGVGDWVIIVFSLPSIKVLIYRRFNAIVSQLKMHYFSEGAFESLIASQLLKKEKYIWSY